MSEEIDASSLVFLKEHVARCLAAAWPHVPKAKRADPAAWAELAGVTKWHAQKHGQPLKVAGICRADGTTSPLALQYIAAEMTRGLKPKRRGDG